MNLRSQRVLVFAALLLARSALAETTNSVPLGGELPNLGLSAVRALGALALVLAIFFGGVWAFRNSQQMAWRKGGTPKLAILESRPLGNRFALHVVGYEQQRLLIGSSPAGITLLSQLPPGAEAAVPAQSAAQRSPFATHLQHWLKRQPVPTDKTEGGPS